MGIITAAAIVGAAATGYSVYQAGEAADDAKREAAKQQKIIDEQNERMRKEKEKQEKAAAERRTRLQSNEMLSGTETGIMNSSETSLLGGTGDVPK